MGSSQSLSSTPVEGPGAARGGREHASLRGRIFNVQRFSLHDGPGIRTTVFLKGCPLDCLWCHNPESISSFPEILFVEIRCIECGSCVTECPKGIAAPGGWIEGGREDCDACGSCLDACPTEARQIAGEDISVEELVPTLLRDRVFYGDRAGGVTFSGGEPLRQTPFLEAALTACREAGLHTAVDTSGLAPLPYLLRIAPLTDLFLFDVKVIDDARHQEYTGASNTTILSNLAALARAHGEIWIRVPVIPGLNDDTENVRATAELAAGLPAVRRVSLLPYHRLGTEKLRRLNGRGDRLAGVEPPTAERMRELAAVFEAHGLTTTIGG